MRAQWGLGRQITAAAAPLLLAAVLVVLEPGMAPASAGGLRAWAEPSGQGSVARALHGGAAGSLCRDCFVVQHWDGTGWRPQDVGVNARSGYLLDAVAAASSRNAWAVGDRWADIAGNSVQRTWIEHWDGTAWTRQASPNPGGPSMGLQNLSGVAATSPNSAWAVGAYNGMALECCAGAGHTMILHWDGTRWARVPAPNPGGPYMDNELSAVAAASPDNAWAVGYWAHPESDGGGDGHTVILHWDGTAWTRVLTPSPDSDSYLSGVAATSPTNAWAVGWTYAPTYTYHILILHWDGTAWTRVPTASPGPNSVLGAVAATSPTNAWAVGSSDYGKALILHWDGTAWTRVPSPSPGHVSGLDAVAATSPTNAWATGISDPGGGFIEHWDGTAWTRVPSQSSTPYGVTATSPTNAWAVG